MFLCLGMRRCRGRDLCAQAKLTADGRPLRGLKGAAAEAQCHVRTRFMMLSHEGCPPVSCAIHSAESAVATL